MKKPLTTLYKTVEILISVFVVFIFIFNTPLSGSEWDNCPFGRKDEPFPGTCCKYIDTDNDSICDLSQIPPEERITANEVQNIDNAQNETHEKMSYYFIPITLVLILIYFITLSLEKKGRIKRSKHRKTWNIILLITFLVSGITGAVLAILVSYGISFSFYYDLLFWHVESGIAMFVISLFHIIWHWKYFIPLKGRDKI
ncbi:MAG TPA: DUF4405 domain-containing protein [Candidatus Krumholzibacteriaceae bacterium]|nr:DUF4405 domain-containing protein [Candidatus Krumholzibacteriaceae bacterium]